MSRLHQGAALLLLALLISVLSSTPVFSSPKQLPKSYQNTAQKQDVLIFTSKFCAACQRLAPEINAAKSQFSKQARFQEFLIESPTGETIFNQFDIEITPSFVIYSPTHQHKKETGGDLSKAQFWNFMKQGLR